MKRRFNVQPQLKSGCCVVREWREPESCSGPVTRITTQENHPEVLPLKGKVKGATGCMTVDSEANLKVKVARSPALPQYLPQNRICPTKFPIQTPQQSPLYVLGSDAVTFCQD